jgi:hypothetical protein
MNDEIKKQIVDLRLAGKSLATVADQFELTRLQVRQIESTYLQKGKINE